jgi:hypothetical protein
MADWWADLGALSGRPAHLELAPAPIRSAAEADVVVACPSVARQSLVRDLQSDDTADDAQQQCHPEHGRRLLS